MTETEMNVPLSLNTNPTTLSNNIIIKEKDNHNANKKRSYCKTNEPFYYRRNI